MYSLKVTADYHMHLDSPAVKCKIGQRNFVRSGHYIIIVIVFVGLQKCKHCLDSFYFEWGHSPG